MEAVVGVLHGGLAALAFYVAGYLSAMSAAGVPCWLLERRASWSAKLPHAPTLPPASRHSLFHCYQPTDKIPMKRCGLISEIAALVAFIVSKEASFTTGFCFDATGGRATVRMRVRVNLRGVGSAMRCSHDQLCSRNPFNHHLPIRSTKCSGKNEKKIHYSFPRSRSIRPAGPCPCC